TCQGGSVATTLATRAPGGKSPLRGALGLFLPYYRVRAEVQCLYSPPSRRITPPRPGVKETPQRFKAGPRHRLMLSVIL
ncbi:hypothetical protein, partial [Enterobacter intestinihominis]